MAEDLTEYLHEHGVRVRYMHSDVETLERIEIMRDLRLGAFDVLVGINLLREGLDIPECALVAILDADKEGFLRSETSLIQTIGRAARNIDGKVILYADHMTGSMERAMAETDRRREQAGSLQSRARHHAHQHQEEHRRHSGLGLRARSCAGGCRARRRSRADRAQSAHPYRRTGKAHAGAAGDLEFEEAARLRDEIKRLQATELAIADDPFARQSAVEDAVEGAFRSGAWGQAQRRPSLHQRPRRHERHAGQEQIRAQPTPISLTLA